MQTVMSETVGMLSRFFPVGNPAAHIDLATDENSTNSGALRPGAIIMGGDGPLARLLAAGLIAENISAQVVDTLESAMSRLGTSANDMLILDLDLPNMNGLKVLANLRSTCPTLRIMAVSSQPGTNSLVAALDNGADDYLPKPFSLAEMMARIRALHRRSHAGRCYAIEPSNGKVVLNKERCQAQRDGRVIDLTPREYTLLEYLMKNPGKTLSRALLTQEVWNMSAETNTNIVDVYIKYLRDKIDGDYSEKLIRTVRGMGYIFHANA